MIDYRDLDHEGNWSSAAKLRTIAPQGTDTVLFCTAASFPLRAGEVASRSEVGEGGSARF
jgi:hypothetical protein